MKSRVEFTICAGDYAVPAQVLRASVARGHHDLAFLVVVADGLPAPARHPVGADAVDATRVAGTAVGHDKLREIRNDPLLLRPLRQYSRPESRLHLVDRRHDRTL